MKAKPLKPVPFAETRGRKRKYGKLSIAHARRTEIRYLKDCMNTILENGAWHEKNLDKVLEEHHINPNSSLTEKEKTLLQRTFDRRNKLATKMENELETYLNEVELLGI